MVRNVIASVLAIAGATAAVWSPFRAWYGGRHGSDYRIGDLFGGITDAKAGVFGSILLPFALAALVALVGLVLRSRILVAVAGVVVIGFAVLWMVRVGQAEGGLTVGSDGTGLGDGAGLALGGGVLLLLAAALMSGRRRARTTRLDDDHQRPAHPYPSPHDQGYRGDQGDQRGVPGYPHDADSPTRTMDQPRWNQQDPSHGGQDGYGGRGRDDHGRDGYGRDGYGHDGRGPYPDEPPQQRP
ncbi:hypothetical protein [Streptomyces lateritius]|uniref:hypothetical protein n=1 Tax=Streptomyces lateritius TaxID=67313 RepID=UPI0016795554|nr:hypothetical protein [Streptomyces lateritius]GGU09177.1 hypothetical protein GCM10010272_62840 [Streptomyces lateritius]